jgi:hypothetical protein
VQSKERALVIVMRVTGALAMCALPFVFVPHSWMNAVHEGLLDMGPLPSEPIVGYLARSTSFFYFFHGALLVMLSLDVKRYRRLVLATFALTLVFGLSLLGVDLTEGLPASWTAGEGPFIVLLALVSLWLLKGVKVE